MINLGNPAPLSSQFQTHLQILKLNLNNSNYFVKNVIVNFISIFAFHSLSLSLSHLFIFLEVGLLLYIFLILVFHIVLTHYYGLWLPPKTLRVGRPPGLTPLFYNWAKDPVVYVKAPGVWHKASEVISSLAVVYIKASPYVLYW